ncbi:MAG: DsrE family protein [Sphingobacterium mizutaii]|nr:DsrE family protein [Sphingobacterium mizutaii]
MRNIIIICSLYLMTSSLVKAQSKSIDNKLIENAKFVGAETHNKHYKAIYQLDSNNPDVVKKAFRNIKNVLNDPRLKDKIEVELITFSGGTEVMLKDSGYEEALKELIDKGVTVAQCTNSLQERKLKKEQLYDFIGYVPSGNGELVIRASEGWVIVKP